MGLLPLAPKASVSTISPPRLSCLLSDSVRFCLRDACTWSEHTEEIGGLILERAFVGIFTMMTGLLAVSLAFLVKVEIHEKVTIFGFDVGVKARIARSGEWSDKALLTVFRPLEYIARSAHERDGIFIGMRDDDFHGKSRGISLSEHRESNPDFTHPKRAYYHYTMLRNWICT